MAGGHEVSDGDPGSHSKPKNIISEARSDQAVRSVPLCIESPLAKGEKWQ